MKPDLTIVHLYPDLLRAYGDRGNILTLRRRCEWRGFSVEVAEVTRGARLPASARLVMLGGGSDRAQEIIAPDILARKAEIQDAAAGGAVVLGVCGGYQLMGHRYVAADGTEIPGLGLLDLATGPGRGRIIGRVQGQGRLGDSGFLLAGFENHGGRTRLGPGCRALASVPRGQGNNAEDGTEGAVHENLVGTYLHGPLLPANPGFADALLQRALAPITGGEPLAPLDDRLELAAQAHARRLSR